MFLNGRKDPPKESRDGARDKNGLCFKVHPTCRVGPPTLKAMRNDVWRDLSVGFDSTEGVIKNTVYYLHPYKKINEHL